MNLRHCPSVTPALVLLGALLLTPASIRAVTAAEADKSEDGPDTVAIEQTVRGAMRDAQKVVAQAARAGKAVAMGFASSGRPSTLVLPGAHVSAEAADATAEDLRVMNRILEKTAARPDVEAPVFFGNWGGLGGRRGPDALYLDGFGALFFLNVDFALVAPAKPKPAAEAAPTDNTWEETRRELQEGRNARARRFAWVGTIEAGRAYDPEAVSELKAGLIKALRHAANLKAVSADETVAIAVFGPAASEAGRATRVQADPEGASVVGTSEFEGRLRTESGGAATAASVMTLRVKKADIDAYAKGDLKEDDFAKRVGVSVR